jgi:hypothetical protein
MVEIGTKAAPVIILRKILFVVMLLGLVGCSSYGSSFSCHDANGLNCLPLSMVDKQIDSGKIAEIELKEKTKCSSTRCYAKVSSEKPDIKPNKYHRLQLQQSPDEEIIKSGNSLYTK